MNTEANILNWDTSSEEVCRKIQREHSDFKIVTKTKNERHLLSSWIEHHSGLVGLKNLIIFDNCSTDKDVLALLEEVSDEAVVVKFSGFHNRIHRSAEFSKLYAALSCSSEYFCLIDSDERLVWVENASKLANSADFMHHLKNSNPGSPRVLPGLWVENLWLSHTRFRLYENQTPWPSGLTVGKPILMTSANLPTMVCHNFQLDLDSPEDVRCGRLMVLHLKNLFPKQRERVNLSKLKQYGIINSAMSDDDAISYILELSESNLQSNNAKKWVREIKKLNDVSLQRELSSNIRYGEIEIKSDGSILHASEAQRLSFEEYLFDPGWFLSLALFGDKSFAAKKPGFVESEKNGYKLQEESEMNEVTKVDNAGASNTQDVEIKVLELPSMSEGGLARFRDLLRGATCYVEYGSGGSTRLAARYNTARIYSVESDPVFAKAVRRAVSWDIKSSFFKMVVPDLGPTGPYGYPRDLNLCVNWWRYPMQVWDSIRADVAEPDLILIDGRFRVYCFLICLLNAKSGARILFDDYSNRLERYGEIEKIVKPIALHDRLAEFVVPRELDFRLISELISKYACDRR